MIDRHLRDVLLQQLSLQNHLLDGSREEEAVDEDMSLLAETPAACDGLCVDRGVPRGFEKDHARGAGDVETYAAGACGEEEEAFGGEAGVEGVDDGLSLRDLRAAVETEEVPVVVRADGGEEVEDLRVGGDDEEELVGGGEDLLDEELDCGEFDAVCGVECVGGVCVDGFVIIDGVVIIDGFVIID